MRRAHPQEILRFAFSEVYTCTSVCISIVVETPECLTYPASGFMLYTPTVIVPKNLSTSMSLLSSSIYSLFTYSVLRCDCTYSLIRRPLPMKHNTEARFYENWGGC